MANETDPFASYCYMGDSRTEYSNISLTIVVASKRCFSGIAPLNWLILGESRRPVLKLITS